MWKHNTLYTSFGRLLEDSDKVFGLEQREQLWEAIPSVEATTRSTGTFTLTHYVRGKRECLIVLQIDSTRTREISPGTSTQTTLFFHQFCLLHSILWNFCYYGLGTASLAVRRPHIILRDRSYNVNAIEVDKEYNGGLTTSGD